MSTLEQAISIAALAHEGQTDKAGASYILHPLRMMLTLETESERIVAMLHDVIEDTPWTYEMLRKRGFTEEILVALETVTKREGEDYESFILRAATNPLGLKVKLADLIDNSDLTRISAPTKKDFARLEKYKRAIATLQAMLEPQ